jgi:PAS domain S-box-containing protein
MPLSDGVAFRVAVESVPLGILVCDERGTIIFVNDKIEGVFGYAASDLVGRSASDLVPAGGWPVLPAAEPDVPDRLFSAGDPLHLVGRRKDGSTVPVEIRRTQVSGGNQRLTVASVLDISERLELQHEIARTATEYSDFEHLVTELAAQFVNVQPDRVDDAIVDSLRRISVMLGFERSSWWQVTKESGDALVTHTWTAPEYRVMQPGDSATVHVPWILSRLREGEIVTFSRPDELPSGTDRVAMQRFGTKSGAALPFMVNGELRAALGFNALRTHREWPPKVVDRLRLVAAVIGQALIRKEGQERLQQALVEVRELKDRLAFENLQLRREVKTRAPEHFIVAESAAAKCVLEQIAAVAPTTATVLLLGETGVGKEVFAQAIHRASDRQARPMLTVNCAAIPAALIESELFGRERGAYTGALARQIGRFERADESTIFLDEVGELPLDAQVKLLRVLQERVIERLGGGQPIKVDVRIIAATNRNLERAVEERTFREDLFYRLNVFPITVPPLRERVEDIPALVWTFIEECATSFRKPIESISRESLAALQRYSWPGNVRELRNVIERAVIVAKGPRLVIDMPPPASVAASPRKSTRLADVEKEEIRRVLESVGWRVRGAGGAAELLGIKPNTLDSRMAKLGIRRPTQPQRH